MRSPQSVPSVTDFRRRIGRGYRRQTLPFAQYPKTEDGQTRVECRFADETLWLSQALIGELFGVSVPTVNEHLKGIYTEGEIAPEATIRKFRIVRPEGKIRNATPPAFRDVLLAIANSALPAPAARVS